MGEPGVSSAARAGPARTGGRGSTLAPNYKDDDEPHVDEGDGAMHGAPRSAPSTPTGDTSQGRVRRGRPRRSTGGGDRARAASTARTKGGAGRDGSRSPRRSTRDVSASPPPRVRDVYALETLSVGSPAGLANPTASCVHTSGPTPDEKQERERKDLSDYHLTKLQPHPTAAAATNSARRRRHKTSTSNPLQPHRHHRASRGRLTRRRRGSCESRRCYKPEASLFYFSYGQLETDVVFC